MSATNILRLRSKFGIDDLETAVAANAAAIAGIIEGGGGGGGGDWGVQIAELQGRMTAAELNINNNINAITADQAAITALQGKVTVCEQTDVTLNTQVQATDTKVTALTTRITTTENNLVATNQEIGMLSTRVSNVEDSYSGLQLWRTGIDTWKIQVDGNSGNASTAITALQTDVATVQNKVTSLETQMVAANLKLGYLAGQAMIGVGDLVGAVGTNTVCTVSGFASSASKQVVSGGSSSAVLTVNWPDPGFQVVPLICWFNDNSSNPGDPFNNDLSSVWLHAQSLTRTQFKVLLEETAGSIQKIRCFVLFYRCDLNIMINV